MTRFDLAACLHAVHDELSQQARSQQTEWVFSAAEPPLMISADATQIAVAVRALCTNALEAVIQGGRVELEIGVVCEQPANSSPAREAVQIAVSDSGPGISPEVRRHLFDPFYSGREAGRGLGFGLTKCWRIVRLHGGSIEVTSTPGEGARFTICLPRSATA